LILISTLPIVVFNLLPVGNTKAFAIIDGLPVDSLILEPRTLTNALGLKPTSENAAEAKGVAPKYMAGYLALAGMLLVPTKGASANAM